jgi:hypothetical protein
VPWSRLARENPGWSYGRIHGELLVLGLEVAAAIVWEILKDTGIDPTPHRASRTWAQLLRSQPEALLACDFFETLTLSGTRMYVLASARTAAWFAHMQRRVQTCRTPRPRPHLQPATVAAIAIMRSVVGSVMM